MGIVGELKVDWKSPWLERLREEGRLAPFKSLVMAVNSSMNGQRLRMHEAERRMFSAIACGVISTAFATGFYFSHSREMASLLGIVAVGSAAAFWTARAVRSSLAAEVEWMDRYLLDAGFKLSRCRNSMSSHRPVEVKLEWPTDEC